MTNESNPNRDANGQRGDGEDAGDGSDGPRPVIPFDEFVAGDALEEELLDDSVDGDELDDDLGELEDQPWFNDEPPTDKQIDDENEGLLRRQGEFRTAAERVAAELAHIPAVRKVVLFGAVAVPLEKEVPRFREYRRAGIELWHECRHVDVAVWVDDLQDLRSLQKARSRAVDELWREAKIGVAQHQVDISLMEPGSDRYLGSLCMFSKCPKEKLECLVPGCGKPRFLQQFNDYSFHPDALAPDRIVVLFDRDQGPDRASSDNEPAR